MSEPTRECPASKDLIGTWRLVRTRAWDDTGAPLPPPYGPEPRGLLAFHDNARMMCVLNDGRADGRAPGEREYASYVGTYRFADDILVTRVDGSADPQRLGTEQVRKVRFEGDEVVLVPPPRRHEGFNEHRELTWERLE